MAASPIAARSSGDDRGARRLFDELLVAPLDRAVALEQMHRVAVAVRENLHLHVPGTQKVLLDVDGVVAERRARLGLGRNEVDLEVLGVDARRACPCRRHPPTP